MNPKKLEKLQSEMDKKIRGIGSLDGKGKCFPILDGVSKPKLYAESKCRILWVLKEPYDDFDENNEAVGGGWPIYYDFTTDKKWVIKSNKTWRVMAKTSLAIINDNPHEDESKIFDIMKEIVIINTSKYPKNTTTDIVSLADYSKIWMPINVEQIDNYEPNVVIFGNTGHLYVDALKLNFKHDNETDLDYCIKASRLYINAYHPGRRKADDDYVQNVYTLFKKLESKISLKSTGFFGLFRK